MSLIALFVEPFRSVPVASEKTAKCFDKKRAGWRQDPKVRRQAGSEAA